MTNKEITTLVKQMVTNTIKDFFSDPDLGREVRKPFLKSLEHSKNTRTRKSLTISEFRKQFGY